MSILVDKLIKDGAIIQAPMAGITTPEFVSAVSNGGGLGSIGAGYLSANETRTFIQEVKEQTDEPYNVNFFVPEKSQMTEEDIQYAKETLVTEAPNYADVVPERIQVNEDFTAQIHVAIEESVPVVSFTFGLPSESIINRLKENDIYVIGTATTVDEAKAVETIGCHAVVVQGSEAGGHRGTFLEKENDPIGLMSLIPQVADEVQIPIIAAGGIMDNRGVQAAYCLGASSVQLGTAFLMTKESGANEIHKQAILEAKETGTCLTKSFSGKTARGLMNQFTNSMEDKQDKILAYPYQNSLTHPMRQAASRKNDPNFTSLWSGQSVRLSKLQSVKQLLKSLFV